jgi:RNA polymerase sigma-70 factor (ECF subfamily)
LTEDRETKIEELFDQFADKIGRYMLSRVGDVHTAEDLTSRVFAVVVRKFEQCRGSPAGWLWSIARTQLIQHYRSHRPAEALEEEPTDQQPLPSEHASRSDDSARIRAAIARLPEEQRELVRMKFFLEMHNQDIARALDMTRINVGVSLHRTLKRLRKILERQARHEHQSPPVAFNLRSRKLGIT